MSDNQPDLPLIGDLPPDERRAALVKIFGDSSLGREAVAIAMGESNGDTVPLDG